MKQLGCRFAHREVGWQGLLVGAFHPSVSTRTTPYSEGCEIITHDIPESCTMLQQCIGMKL